VSLGNTQVLSDLRIIEIGRDVSTAYAARFFAIYGAEVIVIEPPEGHSIRWQPPWPENIPDPEKSLLFAYLGGGKKSVVIDFDSESDLDILRNLLLSSHGVLDSYPPGYLASYGLDLNDMCDKKKDLSVAQISPYGQFGPQAKWKASSITAAASGGQMYLAGDIDKPPLFTVGHQAYYQSGVQGFGALLAGIYSSKSTGIGEIFDLSIQEIQAATLEGGGPAAMWYGGEQTRSSNNPRALWGIYECLDGWIGVASMPRQTKSVLDAMGHSGMKDDPIFNTGGWNQESDDLLKILVPEFTATRTAKEIFEIADRHRAPFGMIPTPKELIEWPNHAVTGFWNEVNHPVLGTHLYPSGPIVFDGDKGDFEPAPTIGQHSDEIVGTLSKFEGSNETLPLEVGNLPMPLFGVRVIDMTQVWSGPYGCRFLADMGADVVKIEGPTFPDPVRTAGGARKNPDIDLAPYFNEYNRGKKGLSLDIKKPEGMKVLKELVATADVFVENWSSGVAERNGLSYDDLKAMKPDLVYISMPGFGHQGPDSSRVGFGPTIEQMGGLVALQGYEGGPPHKSGISYGDPIAGSTCAASVIASLVNREKTGEGMYCVIPQRDGVTGLVGEYFVAESLGIELPIRTGSRHLKSAPHNVYETLPDKEGRPVMGITARTPNPEILDYAFDRWVTIDCQNDAEWKSIVGIVGDDRLKDEKFQIAVNRRKYIEDIDEVISEWAKNQDAEEISKIFQNAGVCAAPVMSPALLMNDAHMLERESFITVTHDIAGKHLVSRPSWRAKRRTELPTKSGPCFGADSDDVLNELGYSQKDVEDLYEKGVTSRSLLGGR
jgi:crotonobetainyl-CoA:carnitine CoA-transferase CaiB-like acyl-CoA transferase